MLDNRSKSVYVAAHGHGVCGSAIVGTGFIGAVHARSARPRRRAPRRRRRRRRPSAPREAAGDARRRARLRVGRGARRLADDVDVVHICAPNHLHAPLAEAALAAGKHVVCEKPLALDAAEAERLVDAGRRQPTASPPCRSSTASTPRSARRASASARGDTGPVHLHPRHLPAGLAAAPRGRQLARRPRPRRRLARVRRHRLALVRPRRVRLRPPHHPRVGADDRPSSPSAAAARRATRSPRGNGDGDAARRSTTEDAAVVQFETDGGALGATVISQISAGRKNRLWLEVDGAEEALAFDQEQPETLWCGRRDGDDDPAPRPRAPLAAGRAPGDAAAPATPRATPHCFDRFVADVYAAIAGADRPDGLPVFADGLRAAAHHRRRARVRARGALGRRARPRRDGGGAMSDQPTPVLEVRGLVEAVPGRQGARRRRLRRPPGRGALPARPERRRASRRSSSASPAWSSRPTARSSSTASRCRPASRARRWPAASRRSTRSSTSSRTCASPRAIFLGHEPRRGRLLDREAMKRRRRRAARAPRPREHPGRRPRARAAARRAAGRLDRARALAPRPAADHGRAVGDPRRQRGRDAVRRRPPPDRRGRRRRLHLPPPRRGPAHRRPRHRPLRRAHGGHRPARRHAARRARREDGRPQGRAAVPRPRAAAATTSSSRSAACAGAPDVHETLVHGARGRGPRHRRARRRRPHRAAAADLRPRPARRGRGHRRRHGAAGRDAPARRSPPAWAWRPRTASRRACCSTGA